jgi:hypothetical protein
VESETADRTRDAESSTLSPVATRSRGRWWLLTALAVCASLVVGGSVQHAIDARDAAGTLYRTQVLTTVSRISDAEQSQIALPVAQRNAATAIGGLEDSINADSGVNGEGTLQVSIGAGSAATAQQIAFTATVSSPHASTTFVVWDVTIGSAVNQGACVLWSSLLGPGRATGYLNLGGSEGLAPCQPQWWSAGPVTATQPRLGLANIPQSPGS